MSPNAHQLRALIARATRPADLDDAETLLTDGNPASTGPRSRHTACAGRCRQGRAACPHSQRCTRDGDAVDTIMVAVGGPLVVLMITALVLRITWVDAISWLAMLGDVIGGGR